MRPRPCASCRQQKGKRPRRGTPWQPTGASIRRETGDTSGGTNPGQTTAASSREYGIPHAAPRISSFGDVMQKLSAGFAVDLLVGYGPINDYKSRLTGLPGKPPDRPGGPQLRQAPAAERRPAVRRPPLGIPAGQQWIPQIGHVRRRQRARARPADGPHGGRRGGLLRAEPDAQHRPPPQRATVPDGKFGRYNVVGGVITGRTFYNTSGFGATCTAPQTYPVAPNANVPGGTFKLVRLLEGSREGWYINAKFASPV